MATEAVPVSELKRGLLQEEAKALADKIASAPESDKTALYAKQDVLAAKLAAAA